MIEVRIILHLILVSVCGYLPVDASKNGTVSFAGRMSPRRSTIVDRVLAPLCAAIVLLLDLSISCVSALLKFEAGVVPSTGNL